MDFDTADLLVTKDEAKERIQECLLKLERISSDDLVFLQRWHQETKDTLEAIYVSGAGKYFENNSGFAFIIRMNEGKILTRANVLRAEGILKRLLNELDDRGHAQERTPRESGIGSVSNDIFIVHGHDELMISEVKMVLSKLELNPIVLREQPNQGATIIEKFEKFSNVGFAIVLMTPDDVGGKKYDDVDKLELRDRARQNVVLELGYFVGSLGRNRVCVLKQDGVETPSDILSVVYTPIDPSGYWKFELARELKAAGYRVTADSLL